MARWESAIHRRQDVNFARWIGLSPMVGRHQGPVVAASSGWLLGRCVAEDLGPDSLPMWLIESGWQG